MDVKRNWDNRSVGRSTDIRREIYKKKELTLYTWRIKLQKYLIFDKTINKGSMHLYTFFLQHENSQLLKLVF